MTTGNGQPIAELVSLPQSFSSETDFRLIAESIPHIAWITGPEGSVEYMNRQGADHTGVPPEATHGTDWLRLIHPDDADHARDVWEQAIRSETPYGAEYRVQGADGGYRWMAARGKPVRGSDGEVVKWVGTCTDIDDQKRVQEHLRKAERQTAESLTLLEAVQATAPVGFGFVDRDFRFLHVNETLAAINGLPIERHLGRTVAEMLPSDLWSQIEPLYQHVIETGEAVVNADIIGQTSAVAGHWLTSFHPVRLDGEVVGIGIVVVDITERQQAADFRAVVMENMAEGLYVLDAEGRLALMNSAASKMLGWTEAELRDRALHETIHHQCADGTPLPEEECELLKVRTEGRTVRIADDVFTRKDGSLIPVAYSAAPLLSGTSVRGVVVVFRETTEEQAEQNRAQREVDTLTWVGRTRDALDEGRMVLHSQPIIPLTGGQRSEELLLRMMGNQGELILPGSFLPVAEKYGLIGEIDRWVVKEAIRLSATGRRVHANISADSLGKLDLLPLIERELRVAGADPSHIVFEITETALIEYLDAAEEFAHSLAEIGCGLALDDFGTGFGSFTYLKRLPITYLKIDIDFVRDLVSNTANQHLVKAIAGLARDFGYETIAEGVEDSETLALLKDYGVDFAQGFHLGRPAPLENS